MRQRVCTFEKQVTRTLHLNYLLYLPKGYRVSGKKRWPLILFLHGAGERGDDIELIKKHGLPKVVEPGRDLPFIALSPQCPQDTWWATHPDALSALLDEVIATARGGHDTPLPDRHEHGRLRRRGIMPRCIPSDLPRLRRFAAAGHGCLVSRQSGRAQDVPCGSFTAQKTRSCRLRIHAARQGTGKPVGGDVRLTHLS